MQHKIKVFSQIEEYLNEQKIDFDFYFEDLTTQESIQLGKKLKYPFASSFKLAVLGAAIENLSSDDLSQVVHIQDKDIPKLAMGVVNYLDAPVDLSYSNLIRLMMGFSDGTSTDLLIRRLGIEKVQEYVARHCLDSKVSHNVSGLLDTLLKGSLNVAVDPKNITRNEYLEALRATTMTQDYSNSKDLTRLLNSILMLGPSATQYLFRDQGVQRLGMYSFDNVRLYGKTGTLGYWVSANDCVVVVVDGEPRALIGLMTLGWKQARYLIEHAFGQVGLMISNLYRDSPVYSPAYGTELK